MDPQALAQLQSQPSSVGDNSDPFAPVAQPLGSHSRPKPARRAGRPRPPPSAMLSAPQPTGEDAQTQPAAPQMPRKRGRPRGSTKAKKQAEALAAAATLSGNPADLDPMAQILAAAETDGVGMGGAPLAGGVVVDPGQYPPEELGLAAAIAAVTASGQTMAEEEEELQLQYPLPPKRPKTAYQLFMEKKRAVVKFQNPSMLVPEIRTVLSQMWRTCTAEERAEWDEMSREDKLRYEREVAARKAMSDQLVGASLEERVVAELQLAERKAQAIARHAGRRTGRPPKYIMPTVGEEADPARLAEYAVAVTALAGALENKNTESGVAATDDIAAEGQPQQPQLQLQHPQSQQPVLVGAPHRPTAVPFSLDSSVPTGALIALPVDESALTTLLSAASAQPPVPDVPLQPRHHEEPQKQSALPMQELVNPSFINAHPSSPSSSTVTTVTEDPVQR